MQRTYMAPIVDTEKRHRERAQKWEYLLVGLLLQRPDLYACVCGILPESDLGEDDARSLYALFNTPADEDKPIQERIPHHLVPTAAKAAYVVEKEGVASDDEHFTKTVVQLAIRIKEYSLAQSSENIQMLLQKAAAEKDKEAEQRYFDQLLAVQRQRYTHKSAQRLNY